MTYCHSCHPERSEGSRVAAEPPSARLRLTLRDDPREIGVQAQAQVGALLWMELRRHDIVLGDDGGELDSVLGDTKCGVRIRLRVVRVHEVEVAAARDTVEQRVVI